MTPCQNEREGVTPAPKPQTVRSCDIESTLARGGKCLSASWGRSEVYPDVILFLLVEFLVIDNICFVKSFSLPFHVATGHESDKLVSSFEKHGCSWPMISKVIYHDLPPGRPQKTFDEAERIFCKDRSGNLQLSNLQQMTPYFQ